MRIPFLEYRFSNLVFLRVNRTYKKDQALEKADTELDLSDKRDWKNEQRYRKAV